MSPRIEAAAPASAETARDLILERYQVDLHDWMAEPSLALHESAHAVHAIAQAVIATQSAHRTTIGTLQTAAWELLSAANTSRTADVGVHLAELHKLEGGITGLLLALDLAVKPFLPRP